MARRAAFRAPRELTACTTAPALAVLEAIGIEAIHAHDTALANRFCAGLGLPQVVFPETLSVRSPARPPGGAPT